MLPTILLFVALLLAGLAAGSAYTTFFLFKPAAETPSAWYANLQYAVPRIGIPLFAIQPIALFATGASAMLAWNDRPAAWFLCMATGALLAGALITRIGHIPINQRIKTWRADALPPEAVELQQRWWRLHIARTVMLLVGASGIMLGALTRS